jgi:MYXO-CTERM domain-containing protein
LQHSDVILRAAIFHSQRKVLAKRRTGESGTPARAVESTRYRAAGGEAANAAEGSSMLQCVRRHLSFVGALVTAGLALSVPGCSGAGPGENVGATSSAITFANDQPAFDYFLGKGLTSFQAAGIVGNLDQESGVDPTAVEGGGPGRGIAQWSVGGRWDTDANDNATWYASMQGQTLLSLQLQLDFIWYELTTFPGYGLAALKQTTNVTDATVVFETDFEGCGTCDQSTRIMYAENVLSAFGGDSVDAGSPPDASTSGDASGVGTPCTVTTTGETGVCMDTSACAALANHVSTPGYCPGPDDVQCCTGPTAVTSNDAGVGMQMDAGVPPPPPTADASTSTTKPDSGAGGNMLDAGLASADADGVGGASSDGGAAAGATGGCATTPAGGSSSGGAVWLAAIAWIAVRTRRRASRNAMIGV